MIPITRYILLTALRDWLFIGVFAAIIMAVGVSFFLGSTAVVEQHQMSIAYAAGSARLTLIVGVVLFVCFHVRRSFDSKEVEVTLSRPLSRSLFVFSYFVGFSVLSVLLALPVILVVWMFTMPDMMGLFYWGASLILEAMLIAAFALVCSLMMQSAVPAVLACGAFYLLSRMMGFFMIMVTNHAVTFQGSDWQGKLYFVMSWIVKMIAVTLPRLDLYGKTGWLLYGAGAAKDMWLFPLQSLIYIPLLLGMAMWDFKRKQF